MKATKRLLFRKSLLRPIACLAFAFSAIVTTPSFATTAVLQDGGVVWCYGDGSAYTAIPNYPADTSVVPVPNPSNLAGIPNPAGTWDQWQDNPILTNDPLGLTAETVTPTPPWNPNDRYAIQLNYWNSASNAISGANSNAPLGYSSGNACMLFYYNTGNIGQFTITYPATPSKPRQTEIDWVKAHPGQYPGFVPFADLDAAGNKIADNPTKGGPTGYVSTFKGCSWDSNSCTTGSKVPAAGVTPTKSSDPNVFPVRFTDLTSIPTQWTISNNAVYGEADKKTPYVAGQAQPHVWDASYDIWFDTTAQTGDGIAPWGTTAGRGQNDGLEIMVWLNSNGSYVDGGVDANGFPKEDQPGLAQPTGHIRERVWINGVFFDVWVGRLNNPYFSVTGGTTIGATEEPHNCPTLTVNGGVGKTCGTEWNVVSFVATKDLTPTDYRRNSMSLDAKVFADYILGIQDGLWVSYAGTVSKPANPINNSVKTVDRAANEVLKCPASNMDQSLLAATIDCLNPNWFLTSVQAGFEPWVGGNGLQSDFFRAHVSTQSTGIQSGLVNEAGNPIIHWQTPFNVVYSGCSAYDVNNHATFNITGFNSDNNNAPMTYPLDGSQRDMGNQSMTTKQFVYTVTEGLYPMHGDAVIHFKSACGNVDVPIFIDPSGRVFYSDGITPVSGATVTLLYSISGNQNGIFVAVPDHNKGLSSPIMQPNDNTQNPMKSTATGAYAWNTTVGWYKVKASLANCGTVTTIAKQVTVGHPVENLNINLPCAAPTPLPPPPNSSSSGTPGVTVKLTINGADWAAGYCRNVVLTNTTSKPITWKVNFNLPYAGNITQTWNLNYTKSGNTVSASGVGWNNVLQPKEVLNSSGFCATK